MVILLRDYKKFIIQNKVSKLNKLQVLIENITSNSETDIIYLLEILLIFKESILDYFKILIILLQYEKIFILSLSARLETLYHRI